jgi:hypothetical protein
LQEREKASEGRRNLKGVEVSKSIESISRVVLGVLGPKNVKMSEDDFNHLKTKAKATEALQLESIRHQESTVKTENQARGWMNKYEKSEDKNKRLTSEVKELKIDIQYQSNIVCQISNRRVDLEKLNRYLQDTILKIKENSLAHLNIAREKMQHFVGKVRMLAIRREFGNGAMNEEIIANAIPSDEGKGAKTYLEFFMDEQKATAAKNNAINEADKESSENKENELEDQQK